MKRAALAVLVAIGCSAAPARAETLPLIEGVPTTYTPGQDFTFTVRVPALVGFSAYSLQLVFNTDFPNPPLVSFPTVAPPGQYVFPTSANFAFQFDAPTDATEVRLTLSDFIPGTVATVPGANDTLATITVSPGADLVGPITLSVGGDSGFEYRTESGQYPFPEPIVIQQAEPTGGGNNPVPAPPGLLLAGVGAAVLGFRSRFTRRTA